jgi:hypothetical protein
MEADQGDGAPHLITGMRQQTLELSIAGGAIIDASRTFHGCYDTYVGDPVAIVSADSFTGAILVRGALSYALRSTVLKLKCTTPGAAGTAKFKFDTGAGVYTGAEVQIPASTWFRFQQASGALTGERRWNGVEIYLHPGGAFSLNDEFTLQPLRTAAVGEYSTRDVLSSAGVEVTLNNGAYKMFKDVKVKIDRPLSATQRVSSENVAIIQRSGLIAVNYTFARDYDDRDFFDAWRRDRDASVIVDMYGDFITPLIEERWKIWSQNCRPTMAGAASANANTDAETLEFEGYTPDGGTTPIYQELIRSTRDGITPAIS